MRKFDYNYHTMKSALLLFFGLVLYFRLFAEIPTTVLSPSGKIKVSTQFLKNQLFYSVTYATEQIIHPSGLGFVLKGNDTINSFQLINSKQATFNETWQPVWGQQNSVKDHYNQLTLELKDLKNNIPLFITFRVYDDGFAFRYHFPQINSEIEIISEESYFNFAENNDCWWIWADYNTLEKSYNHTSLEKASHVAVPFTMKTQKGTHISIHEAALDDYASMTLKQSTTDSLSFKVNLVPWSDGTAIKKSTAFSTPWRTVFVSPNAAGLIESSLLLNLNEPCKIEDCTWIKPINYIGVWWEMHLGISTWGMKGGRHGATTENTKRYIDFAAQNGIQGVLIEGWNTGWENWGAKDAFDYVTPYPDFDIYEVVRYAKSKKIEIIGHHETGGDIISYEKNLDSAFAFYKSLGIKYVKTGYAGPVNPPTEWHHGQYMVRHYNKIMETAAKYGIMLDVHEPVIPTGLSRTYPNLMTFEAVRGMEWNAWSEGNPPSHTCTLPFTRGMAGPMDYTPGIFDIHEQNFAEKRVKWNDLDKGNSTVHSTISNQIALMIVLYSPLQMASDMIENYENHPAFEFVKEIPTTWDETKVLDAQIGEYIVIARRKGTKWYIAGITNEQARTVTINLDLLDSHKNYTLKKCIDAENAHFEKNPTAYVINEEVVNSSNSVKIKMAEGGGMMLILSEPK